VGERRNTRKKNDGRTSLEKAQNQRKKGDLEDIYGEGKHKNLVNLILLDI
jgi:hypothetical protein